MDTEVSRDFRYLDTEGDRQEFAADIRRVRQSVIQLAESVPQDRIYEPRYHGWSLAALMAHLHTIDNLALFGIKLALLGIQVPISSGALNAFNDTTARLFQNRVLATTIRGINQNENRIINFIMTLPLERFSRTIYHPQGDEYLTVEKALQQYFLFHWQEHLQTIQRGEGIYYEPPAEPPAPDASTEA